MKGEAKLEVYNESASGSVAAANASGKRTAGLAKAYHVTDYGIQLKLNAGQKAALYDVRGNKVASAAYPLSTLPAGHISTGSYFLTVAKEGSTCWTVPVIIK